MARSYQQDWEMDSRSHRFNKIANSNPCFEILSILNEYDETCQEARAQMIKKINKFIPDLEKSV